MAWTSDARNLCAARCLEGPVFGRLWARVVKRTARPPEDPNRQVTVKIEGDRARITLDAQTGAELPDRHYLNFLPTEAVLVEPSGAEQRLPLPQVAPGRYEATVPVQADGVYTLTATQTDPTTGERSVQSGGFVVPYSPEYSLTGTAQNLLESLPPRTGGKLISDPSEAFTHTLPSVGAPRPLWPLLMIALAILVVADVGVRRVRISVPELRAGYAALRRRLGYIDDPLAVSPRLAAAAAQRPDKAKHPGGVCAAGGGDGPPIPPPPASAVREHSGRPPGG